MTLWRPKIGDTTNCKKYILKIDYREWWIFWRRKHQVQRGNTLTKPLLYHLYVGQYLRLGEQNDNNFSAFLEKSVMDQEY